MKMGLCYNINYKQCANENGHNNDSSDVMAKRESDAKVNNEHGHH